MFTWCSRRTRSHQHISPHRADILPGILHMRLLFFFSSRRRHTRLQGDWSSDVCSSDLQSPPGVRALTLSVSDAWRGLTNGRNRDPYWEPSSLRYTEASRPRSGVKACRTLDRKSVV